MKPAHARIASIFIILLIAASITILVYQSAQQKPTAQVIRIACIGDSITAWSHYPEELQKKLGDGYVVGNFGVAGSAVSKNSDKPYINQTAFQEAKDFQPTVIVIMLGTNDAKDNNYRSIAHFPDDYEDLISQYDQLPDDQQIWLVKPPPIYNNDLGLNDNYLENGVIPRIDQVADDMNLPVIDVNSPMTNHSEYFNDGVHPNADGAAVIADTINDALSQDDLFNYWEYPMSS